MRFALLLSLLLALVAVVFALYNPEPVTVNLIWYTVSSPLAVVILVLLFVGALLGILACLPTLHAYRTRARDLEKYHGPLPASVRTTAPPPSAAQTARTAPVVVPTPPATGDAAETQRLAEETQRMAAEAQRRANEEGR